MKISILQLIVYLHLCFFAVGALPVRGETSASLSARSRSFVGINDEPIWNFKAEELSTFTKMLRESKAGAVRIPLRWRVIEPHRGVLKFDAVDRALAAIPDDVEILATLMSVPTWANGKVPGKVEGWHDAYPPSDLKDWEKYIFTTVSRYKNRIRHWEIWNEQNGVDFYRPLPDAAGYLSMLKTAYAAAKRADPECVVVLGGLQMNGIIANPWSPVKTPGYLEALYKEGARPYFDLCNIHPYVLPEEGAEEMMRLISDTLSLMDRYGDTTKSVWLTEVGCGAKNLSAELDQAHLLSDTFRLAAGEPRIGRVFWFMLRDMEKDLIGPEGSMGLFSFAGRAKPSLEAFQASASVTGK